MKLLVFAFALTQIAWGHARLATPTPRSNNAGIKSGPCGGLPKGVAVSTFQVGQSYTVTVQETIQHPGHFIVNLLNGNHQLITQLANVVDTIQVGTQNVTITMNPALGVGACTDCVLQLIQSMEENPAVPTFYYSCADILITDPMAVATPIPIATPTPTPPASTPTPGSQSPEPSGDIPTSQTQAAEELCGVH